MGETMRLENDCTEEGDKNDDRGGRVEEDQDFLAASFLFLL